MGADRTTARRQFRTPDPECSDVGTGAGFIARTAVIDTWPRRCDDTVD